MERLAEAKFPVDDLHAGTAKSLERYRLIERRQTGWVLTDTGRNHLVRKARNTTAEALETEFPAELRERLERVLLWLQFTKRLEWPYRCRPLIMALLLERDFHFGARDEKRERWIKREVQNAIQIVRDLEEANAEAIRIGGEVGVTIEAHKANPVKAVRRRQRDVAAASKDGAVDLGAFRKRRMVPS